MLEAIEDVGTETDVVVLILLVSDILDEHRRVEVNQRAGHALTTVLCEVDGCERTVGAVTLANHRGAAPSTGMRIEIVSFFTCLLILHLYQVGSIHRVPLSIYIIGEDRTLVAPLAQILNGSRPHADIRTTIGGVVDIVRTNDIGTVLPGVIRIFKHTGFAIWHMLPQREIRILCPHRHNGKKQQEQHRVSFHFVISFGFLCKGNQFDGKVFFKLFLFLSLLLRTTVETFIPRDLYNKIVERYVIVYDDTKNVLHLVVSAPDIARFAGTDFYAAG